MWLTRMPSSESNDTEVHPVKTLMETMAISSEEDSDITDTVEIYVDGGCRGNPGIGARAYIIINTKGQEIRRYSKSIRYTTNNKMELSAVMDSLNYIKDNFDKKFKSVTKIIIYSDSQYVVSGLNQWIFSWIKQGILDKKANSEYWSRIYSLFIDFKSKSILVNVKKVKAHSGVYWNEVVDKLVNESMDSIDVKAV